MGSVSVVRVSLNISDQVCPPLVDCENAMLSYTKKSRKTMPSNGLPPGPKRESIHTAYRLPFDSLTSTSGIKSPLRIGHGAPVGDGTGQATGSGSIVLLDLKRLTGN